MRRAGDNGSIGSIQALAWAMGKALPAKHKLVLIYLAENHRDPAPYSTTAIARWAGLQLHEPARILRSLRRRGLIEFHDSTRIIYLRTPE